MVDPMTDASTNAGVVAEIDLGKLVAGKDAVIPPPPPLAARLQTASAPLGELDVLLASLEKQLTRTPDLSLPSLKEQKLADWRLRAAARDLFQLWSHAGARSRLHSRSFARRTLIQVITICSTWRHRQDLGEVTRKTH